MAALASSSEAPRRSIWSRKASAVSPRPAEAAKGCRRCLGKVVHALGELGHVIAEGVERVGQIHAQLFADALAVALQHGAGGADLAGGLQKAGGAFAADLAEALQRGLLRLLQSCMARLSSACMEETLFK